MRTAHARGARLGYVSTGQLTGCGLLRATMLCNPILKGHDHGEFAPSQETRPPERAAP